MSIRHADSISEQLEELIFDGTFANGDRLDEVRLSEQFGVSRTPLREAFQRLAQSNLLELIPRRGAFVRQPGPAELLEMFEAMAEIEAACGRLAASRITQDALDQMHHANKRCKEAIEIGNPDLYYTANSEFHALIYQQCGNGYMEQHAIHLHRRLKPFRRQQLRLRGRMAQSMAEHEAILEALNKGNAAAAQNALRNHVAVQGEKFFHLMSSLKSAEHNN